MIPSHRGWRLKLVCASSVGLLIAGASAAFAQVPAVSLAHEPVAGKLVVTLPAAATAAEHTSPTREAQSKIGSQLQGLRVRNEGTALRIVFLFDKPTPYALRTEPDGRRATLDLIGAKIAYLPAEAARIGDPRLDGIWIRRLDAAMASLDFVLPSPNVKLEHFALSDPPAVVIDLMRTDLESAPMSGPQINATLPTEGAAGAHAEPKPEPEHVTAPVAAPGLIRGQGGAVVPGQLQEPTGAAATSSSLAVEHPSVQGEQEPENAETAGSGQLEGFPIEAIRVGSALAREVREAFEEQRWGAAHEAGLAYLKNNPLSQEGVEVLYLVAEARWRLGMQSPAPPVLEMMNYYDQALRTHDGGRLGSFARMRLAQGALLQDDQRAALHHIEGALQGAGPAQRNQLKLMKVGALTALGEYPEGLKNALELGGDADPALQLEGAKAEGAIRLAQGDGKGAWEAYERASALDPQWTRLDYEGWEKMALAARDAGEYRAAMGAVEELLRNYENRDNAENYKLLLLQAELLEKLGMTRDAKGAYAQWLHEISGSKTAMATQEAVRERFPEEVLRTEGNYALLLHSQGDFGGAMKELNRIHEVCLRDGIDPKALQPVIQEVLPDYMQAALAADAPFDAAQAWRHYGHYLKDEAALDKARTQLAGAMEKLGLAAEALALMPDDAPDDPPSRILRRARLRILAGEEAAAVAMLQRKLPAGATPAEQAEADYLLAKTFQKQGRTLEAAQALQLAGENPALGAAERGEALAQGGLLYLKAGMPAPAIELGIKGLMFESDARAEGADRWDAATGRRLRLMLGRAYFDREDYGRAEIVLGELASDEWCTPEERAMARLLAARSRQRLGRLAEAAEAITALAADPKTPAFEAEQGRELQKLIEWDRAHPQWSILSAKGQR